MKDFISYYEFLKYELEAYAEVMFFPCSLTPFCWYSLPRGQKEELTLTTNLWMNAWKAFVKCMKNIWREWIPTAPLSHMISASCLILLMIWQTSAALFTELIPRHTSLITKTGLKRRSTCSFVGRPNRLGNSCVGSIKGLGVGLEHRCVQRAVVEVLYYSNPVSILVHSSPE